MSLLHGTSSNSMKQQEWEQGLSQFHSWSNSINTTPELEPQVLWPRPLLINQNVWGQTQTSVSINVNVPGDSNAQFENHLVDRERRKWGWRGENDTWNLDLGSRVNRDQWRGRANLDSAYVKGFLGWPDFISKPLLFPSNMKVLIIFLLKA